MTKPLLNEYLLYRDMFMVQVSTYCNSFLTLNYDKTGSQRIHIIWVSGLSKQLLKRKFQILNALSANVHAMRY